VIIFTKGADSAVFEKAKEFEHFVIINKNINSFAKEGLRTLLFAKRTLSMEVYQGWLDRRNRAKRKLMEKLCSKEEYTQ
jgi:magnesium-transporting ATPase (P-type)